MGHVGPYDELQVTRAKLEAWTREQGSKTTGEPWESYWTDPGLESDPKKLRTQIPWPIE